MAYNPNVPVPINRVQDDIAAMRDNFQHLAPLAQAVDELQTVSELAPVAGELQTVSELAPVAGELQTVSELAPYVQAILDSRIVEMGSNSNGEYVRWENGLQVCFIGALVTSASEDTVWTLPAAFIDSNWVFCSGVGATIGVGAQVITFQGRTTNSITLRVLNASGARVSGTAFIIAI